MSYATAKQLFLDALDEPRQSRDEFIDRACNGDDNLRSRVLSLLRAHEVDDTTVNVGLSLTPAAIDELMQPAAPKQIAGYHLSRILGRGGFGVVWLAEQFEPLRRQVALKLLHPSLIGFAAHPAAAAEVIARFEAERQALASMDHPNVARVIDAGKVPDGPHANQPYFAMEFVDGPSLIKYCNRHALSIRARLELFCDVCAGVQHAHQRGLIHRDLKPGNVLVATVDGKPTPKVIDFGVSKAVGQLHVDSAITQQSAVIGTPQYMAPEQAQIGGATVDTRSDVYSLGAVLYELLTGAPPIAVDTIRGLRLEQICALIRDTTLPAPSSRLPNLASELRGELDWIVLKALSKEPEHRYQSAAEFAADIRRHLSHQPIVAGPPSRVYKARKFVRRHRIGVAMSVAALLFLIATTVFWAFQADRARKAELAAIAQAEQAKKQADKFEAMASFSQGILRSIDPAVARSRDVTLMREVLDAASRRISKNEKIDPEAAAAIHSMIGYANGAIGEADKAVLNYKSAMLLSEKAFGETHEETFKEGGNYFLALIETGQTEKAKELAAKLIRNYEKSGQQNSLNAATLYANLASVCIRQDDVQTARTWLERAVRSGALATDPKLASAVQNNLGVVYIELKEFAKAKELFEQLLEQTITAVGEDHPYALTNIANLGIVAEQMGDFATAERRYLEVVAGRHRIFPPANSNRVRSDLTLAEFYIARSRFADAIKALEPTYADVCEKLPAANEMRLEVTLRLAEAYRGGDREDESTRLLESIRTTIESLPLTHKVREQFAKLVSTAPRN